jgi:hypothetical protein
MFAIIILSLCQIYYCPCIRYMISVNLENNDNRKMSSRQRLEMTLYLRTLLPTGSVIVLTYASHLAWEGTAAYIDNLARARGERGGCWRRSVGVSRWYMGSPPAWVVAVHDRAFTVFMIFEIFPHGLHRCLVVQVVIWNAPGSWFWTYVQ